MIIGERIYLRPLLNNDVIILNKWKNEEEVYKNLGGGFMPTSVDTQVKWMESMIDTSGKDKRFIICNKEDTPIGMIGLYDINWIHRHCEIGIFIGENTFRGKGFGKEACQLIEKFAKEFLNLRKIKLNVVAENDAAVHMWESLGYKAIGERIDERFIKGEFKNLVLMEKFI